MTTTTKTTRRDRQKAETRVELLEAAHALVREGGYEDLTIRKLAKRVGYATMSVYSYFPDKHSILLAIAQDAFAALARRMERDAPDDPVEALKMLMRSYTAFGLENPNEYRTVFMTTDSVHHPDRPEPEMAKQNPALQLLLGRVQACIDAGVLSGDTHAIATLLWTFGHGTVSLLINFPLYPFGDRDAYVERVIETGLAGVSAMRMAPLTGADPDC